jgi:heterotetrameric sarcosine oxidase gamma subunit
VPELIAKTALNGPKPLVLAGTTLAELDPGPITSIALFPGGDASILSSLGLSFPSPNRFVASGDALLVWTGRDQAFLIGVDAPDMGARAAVTDQSGGWVTLTLIGPNAAAALARYVPLDFRQFAVGHAARAPLYHMQMILLRTAPDAFRLMLFRSMARTAWHEIEVVLKSIAARMALT